MATDASLMQFPCDFQIKIMGKNCPKFQQDISALAYKHFEKSAILSIRVNPSKQNNYLGISMTLHVLNQQTLDALYFDLSKHPDVKMVL